MSEVATLSPAAPGPGQSNGMIKRERRNWFLALLVAFALGFLLACNLAPRQVLRANCPRPDDKGPPLAMNGSTSGHGSRGRGSPEKIGSPGEETGDHVGKAYGTAVEGGGGTPGRGSNGDGDLRGGKQWQAHGEEQTFGRDQAVPFDTLMAHITDKHSSVDAVGRIAQQAGVKTLVLSHLTPAHGVSDATWRREVAKAFKGEILIAEGLMVI